MIKHKLFQQKKISSLFFHLSFLVIVVGAAVTRYAGFEGVMLIREGEASNEIISTETFLQIKTHNNIDQYTADIPITIDTNTIAYIDPEVRGGDPINWFANIFFDHNNYFEHKFDFKERDVKISCVDIIKNPKDTLIPDVKGDPYLELVTGGVDGRTYHYLKSGEVKMFESGLKIGFNNHDFPDAINVIETDSGLYVQSPFDLDYIQMADQSTGIVAKDSLQYFIPKRLYMVGGEQFAFNQYYLGAIKKTISSNENMQGLLGLTVKIEEGDFEKEVILKGGKGQMPRPEYVQVGDLFYELSFGSKIIEVPFFLYLRDFQLERYPGTKNPSSFASEVTLIDEPNNLEEEHRIYMNSVLDYGGYRFFQSSYDMDELGTILSVNHDRPGTYLTYLGYALMGLGFFINLFSKKSRFRMLMRKTKEIRIKRESIGLLLLLFSLSFNSFSQEVPSQPLQVVNQDHADKFARLVVQDQGGRFKPVHTLANDILKKINRQTTYEGQNAMQVFLGVHANPIPWLQEPIIFVSGKPLRDKFNLDGKYAALVDFMSADFEYLLYDDAQESRMKKASERSQYDKDVLKTDERYNIL